MNGMRFFMLMCMVMPATSALSEPASRVAWTPETLAFVKNGNAARGEDLADTCVGCHGENGVSSTPDFPSLAGQLANYTFKQLQDYVDGRRADAIMSAVAAGLSKQDRADLAVWFQSQPAPPAKLSEQSLVKAEIQVFRGDSKRILPPCSACHGTDGRGSIVDTPALAGQQHDYLSKVLRQYKNGERHNDIYSRMRLIAEQLSEVEIDELGYYYENLGEPLSESLGESPRDDGL